MLKNENKNLKEEKLNLLATIESLVRSTIDFAAEYAATALQRALINFGDGYKRLLKLNEFVADTARDEAINLQQNGEQKEKMITISKSIKIGERSHK